jgi:hypothetical protein
MHLRTMTLRVTIIIRRWRFPARQKSQKEDGDPSLYIDDVLYSMSHPKTSIRTNQVPIKSPKLFGVVKIPKVQSFKRCSERFFHSIDE